MAIKRFHPRNFTKGFNLQLPKGEKDEKWMSCFMCK
jgi:hypothetical protein